MKIYIELLFFEYINTTIIQIFISSENDYFEFIFIKSLFL